MNPVITLACDPYALGEEVAEIAARELGWPLVSSEVFAAAARILDETEERVESAIRRPPSFLGMSATTRKRLLAGLGAAITEAVLPGGVVYRGPAGHHFLVGVSHVIRVKVGGAIEDRARRKVEAEGCDAARAAKVLLAADRRRLRTCREVFGEDCGDPDHYDLFLSTSDSSVPEATARIVRAAGRRKYRAHTWSVRCLKSMALAWRVRAELSRLDPDVLVEVGEGVVELRTRLADSPDDRICRSMRDAVAGLPGVEEVVVETSEDLFRGRGSLLR